MAVGTPMQQEGPKGARWFESIIRRMMAMKSRAAETRATMKAAIASPECLRVMRFLLKGEGQTFYCGMIKRTIWRKGTQVGGGGSAAQNLGPAGAYDAAARAESDARIGKLQVSCRRD